MITLGWTAEFDEVSDEANGWGLDIFLVIRCEGVEVLREEQPYSNTGDSYLRAAVADAVTRLFKVASCR